MRKSIITFVLVTAVISAAALEAAAEHIVIVNSSNPTTTIRKGDVARLFLKQTTSWQHGEKVVPVDLDSKSRTRVEFTTEVLGRSLSAVLAYWNQKVFSGAEVPPAQKTSDSQVIEFVRANPGAVGYVSGGSATDSVKVLQIVE